MTTPSYRHSAHVYWDFLCDMNGKAHVAKPERFAPLPEDTQKHLRGAWALFASKGYPTNLIRYVDVDALLQEQPVARFIQDYKEH